MLHVGLQRFLAAGALLFTMCSSVAADDGVCDVHDETCKAAANEKPKPYIWPMQKGDLTRTGASAHIVTSDLSKGPTWSWNDPHSDVIRASPVIDDEMNIYLTTLGGRVYKFSAGGEIVWEKKLPYGPIQSVPALMGGSLFSNSHQGYIFSVSMASGEVEWAVKVANETGMDCHCLFAHEGIVISAARGGQQGNKDVVAVRAEDGSHLWTFTLDDEWRVYNLQISAPGDGSIVFQDSAGGLYRLDLHTGRLLWQSGLISERQPSFFSTAAAVVGPNDLVFVSSNYHLRLPGEDDPPFWDSSRGLKGIIHAYQLKDGIQAWREDIGLMANQAVAVGVLAGSEKLAVVAGFGENPGLVPMLVHLFFMMAILLVTALCKFCCCGYRCCRKRPVGFGRSLFGLVVFAGVLLVLILCFHELSIRWAGRPNWLFRTKVLPSALVALDAETGARRWSYTPPPFERPACEGDEAFLLRRLWNINTGHVGDPICLPDSWSQAVIGGDGTVYAGCEDGHLYAVRDADGDGHINNETEVSRFYFGHAFQASQAIAPGLLAVAPCGGGLHVWRN